MGVQPEGSQFIGRQSGDPVDAPGPEVDVSGKHASTRLVRVRRLRKGLAHGFQHVKLPCYQLMSPTCTSEPRRQIRATANLRDAGRVSEPPH
jgi:hypothetical protein